MAVFYVIPLTKATTKEVYNPLLNGKANQRSESAFREGEPERGRGAWRVAVGGGS
jgi:hypothetical protein